MCIFGILKMQVHLAISKQARIVRILIYSHNSYMTIIQTDEKSHRAMSMNHLLEKTYLQT